MVAHQPVIFGLGDGLLEPLDGQRILSADVDVGVGRADGVRREGHALQQAVGIALADGAIHEGAGIALIRVADQVLVGAGRLAGELPFSAGGKAATAAPAQAGRSHQIAKLVGGLGFQRECECRIPATGNVLIDAARVDQTAVGEHHPALHA